MKGLTPSPVELSDSSADLFSNDTLRLNPLSATTNYECNSDVSTNTNGIHMRIRIPNWNKFDSKRQYSKSITKAHRFRFWLNKKDCKGLLKNRNIFPLEKFDKELRQDDSACEFRTNNQVSLYNEQISLDFFSDEAFNEIDRSFSPQPTICELDNEILQTTDVDHLDGINQSFVSQAAVYEFNSELYDITDETDTVIVSYAAGKDDVISISEAFICGFEKRRNECLEKQGQNHNDTDLLPDTEKRPLHNKIVDEENISANFLDAFDCSEENSDVVDVILQQSMISDITVKHSTGTLLGSFSDPWLEPDSSYISWNEQESVCGQCADFHSSFFKRKMRLKFLVHYFRNKLSRERVDPEIQLLGSLWHSILMRKKNAY